MTLKFLVKKCISKKMLITHVMSNDETLFGVNVEKKYL